MKTKFILLLATACFVILGCSEESVNSTEEEITEDPISEIQETTVEAPLEGLKLNEGAKWKVDSTTHAGMQTVDSLINNFDEIEFVALGTNIKTELSNIIKQCNMKGEDHDQYHIVLHAMMKESKALKSGESETTENIIDYSVAYFTHFEL